MSEKYDEYLRSHITAVGRAARWMEANLGILDDLPDDEARAFLDNVAEHDRSKYGLVEYAPYDNYFYGTKNEDAFNVAWLHHIHHNPHHWQYWVLVQDDGELCDQGKMVALEMPRIHVLEMVADWWSFSWRSGDLEEIFGWYDEHRGGILLHPSTREYVESVLGQIRDMLGEEVDE